MDKIQHTAPMIVNMAKDYVQEAIEKETPKGWVNYGDNNLFPQYLIDLYNTSSVHGSLTMSIAFTIAGKEFSTDLPIAKRELERLKLDDIRSATALDLKLHGGFFWEVVWSVDRTTIARVNHLPFENCRLAVANEEDVISGIYYSKDWSDTRKKKNTPVYIPMFNKSTNEEEPSQVLFMSVMTPGSAYYPKPDYYSGLEYIECTRQISHFYNAFLQNGMFPGYMIHFNNGVPDPEEQIMIKNQWEKMSGTQMAGKRIFTFNESQDRAPKVDLIPLDDADKKWTVLSEESRNNIMISHRVTSPLLFGIRESGGLGSNSDELKQAFKIFKQQVIEPYQRLICDAVEILMKSMGIVAEFTIVPNDVFGDNMTAQIEEAPKGVIASSDMAAIIAIAGQVKSGAITSDQAHQLIHITFPALTHEQVRALLGEGPVQLKKKVELESTCEIPHFSEEDENWWCSYLEDKGEIVDEEEWELIEAEPVDMASVRSYADPNKPSEMDSGLYKIRYSYSKNLSANSRKFCRQMVAASKAGYVYRYEDLTAMSADTDELNPKMAQRGSSTYSVFLYHGGVNCKHHFERKVYFRKREKGKFLADKGLENSDPISVAKAIRAGMPLKDIAKGFATANTPTYDQPNHGRVNI
jgi:hypothetical protein